MCIVFVIEHLYSTSQSAQKIQGDLSASLYDVICH